MQVVALLILAAALVALVVLLAILFFRLKACERALQHSRDQAADLGRRVEALAPYQTIVDAQAHARTIIDGAQRAAGQAMAAAQGEAAALVTRTRTELENAARQAEFERRRALDGAAATVAAAQGEAAALMTRTRTELENAARQAESERRRALEEAAEAQQRANAIFANANVVAARIVEEAKARAQETAGEAFAAMQNLKQLEKAALAMKNVIEGYGDQYIIPTFTLLDQLAEHFGYAEAGQHLKAARERVREMVKSGSAATCEYVEEARRTTAIAFVVDAFNGKVDTVLADVRDDNYGKLAQKIKDAFALVNQNGEAFRRARITDAYLEARLEELRWAVTATELKRREQEEQRSIKERLREEERVRREQERNLREAARDEESLRKAMEKVKGQVETATEAQRQKYEAMLADYAERLRQAEERSQRVKSLAEQTKRGHVYVISNVGSFGDDVFKIGQTRRAEPQERVDELGDASVPFEFDVHAMIDCMDAPSTEHALHRRFVAAQVNKVNPRKEFFHVPLAAIRAEVERLGLAATWTMVADAREYRESQAVEKALRDDPVKGREWLDAQTRRLASADRADEKPLVSSQGAEAAP